MTLITGFTYPPTIYFKFITKCDSFFYYKVRQLFYYEVRQLFYYKVRQVLQSVTILLQSATGVTKCDDYYKVRQYRQYSVKDQLPSEVEENLWRIFRKSRKELFPASVFLAEFLKSSTQLLKLKTV